MEKDLDEAGRRIASFELQNDALENKKLDSGTHLLVDKPTDS